MPKKLKMSFPVVAKINKMIAAIMQAMRAIRMRSCGESLGVIARKAGTIAIGSRITNSELAASRTYSCRFMERFLSFFRMHWDHEPVRTRSSRRESAQASPMKNERTHARCYKLHGKPPFIYSRIHRDHKTTDSLESRLQPVQTVRAA